MQALDMRPFGEGNDWSEGTMVAGNASANTSANTSAVGADRSRHVSTFPLGTGPGSLDMLIDLRPGSGRACRDIRRADESFWTAAKGCREQTQSWIDSGWARESLYLFGAGWEFMNMNRVVELGAQAISACDLGAISACDLGV